MIRLYLLGLKALKALKALPREYDQMIECIIVGRDKNVQNDYSVEILEEANKRNIIWHERKNEPDFRSNYSIAIGWRWLMQNTTLLIVFHDSLLPKYRGFNPLVSALINCDKEIGVTALKASKSFDEGPIIYQWKTSIDYPIKIAQAIEKVSEGYVELFKQIVKQLSKGIEPKSYTQSEQDVSYSVWRDESDYLVDWSWPASKIKRFIDAVGFPYDGALSRLDDGRIIKILDAHIWSERPVTNPGYGKVLLKEDGCPVVVAHDGLVKITAWTDLNGEKVELPEKLRYRFL